MTLENTIRQIINNNAGLLASYSKAADGFGAPECQRPRGKFQTLVTPDQDILDPARRDMTPADLCPSCASSSSPLCSCLEAYIDYDYYTWRCVSGGGFGDVTEPPLKQLPGHCPSFESLGIRGQISNYQSFTDQPYGFVLFEYTFFIDSILGRNPAIGLGSTTGDQGPNILGPSNLTARPFYGPTSLADWQGIFDGTHPLSAFYYNQGIGGARSPGQKTLIKMMFDARCGISEQALNGACCTPENFGGFNCTAVNSQKECQGQFHPGKTCRDIGFNNCGTKDLTIRPDRIRTTELSKALVNALMKNKKIK